MIQDIYPYVFNNHYEEKVPDDNSYAVFTEKNSVLARLTEEGAVFPKMSELKYSDSDLFEAIYLFSIKNACSDTAEEDTFFIFEEGDIKKKLAERLLSLGYSYMSAFALRNANISKLFSFTAVTACQLAAWYHNNKYCGCCGKPMSRDHSERMVYCPECKSAVYPKICPAVIVAVINGDSILLSKYAGANGDHYALIAGFAEIGETIEETVHREVAEEVGIRVKNLRYYKSQPWSFTDSLLFGFFCELDGSDSLSVDEHELSEASFVKISDLPDYKDEISLTYEMIRKFKDEGPEIKI